MAMEEPNNTDIEFTPRAERRRKHFPLNRLVLSGDRGMRRALTLPGIVASLLVAFIVLVTASGVAPGENRLFNPGVAEAAAQITVDFLEGEHAPANSGQWVTGNLGSYPEGSTIRFRLVLTTTEGPASGTLTIGYTSEADCRFFTNALPTNVSITGGSVSVGNLTQAGDDLQATFTITSLPTGSPQYLNFTLRLSQDAAACGNGSSQHVEIDDTSGAVKSSGAKTLPMPIQDVIPITDITVQKTGTAAVSIGGNIQYTVTVTNLDAITAAGGVVATDTLPAGVTFSSGSWTKTAPAGNGNCTAVAQVVTCNIGILNGAATATVTINGTVANNPALCGTTLTNNVSVSTTTQESNTNNNSASFNTTVNACASSTFTVNKVYASGAGSPVTITLDCSGNGVIAPTTDTANTGDPAVFGVTGMTAAETCTATESNLAAGYSQTNTTCGAPGVNLPANGGSASCTITNALNSATFTVNKVYAGGVDGPAVSMSLDCGSGTEGGPHNADDPTPDAVFTVTGIAGASTTCTATEVVPPGYAQTGSDCTGVTLAANGTASCTITNSKLPTLTIDKVCVGSQDGSFTLGGTVPAGFATTITCGPVLGPVALPDGTAYNITETVPAGWQAGDPQYTNCSGTLSYGQDVTCTISNVKLGAMQVTKTCTPAEIDGITFTFNLATTAAPNTVLASTTVDCNSTGDGAGTYPPVATFDNLAAGSYVVTETAVDGFQTNASDCANEAVTAGQTASCTITNTQNSATFTVNKAYVGANGPAVSISLDCGTGTEGGPHNADDPTPDAVFTVTGIVGASTICTATETAPDGYTQTATTCADVVLAATGSASCTITNTQNSATFTVNKAYVGANGPAVSISLDCGTGTEGGPHNADDPTPDAVFTVTGIVGASTTCTATETAPDGYTQTATTCADVVLAATGSASCTITNTQNSATFTVNKAYVGANGPAVSISLDCGTGTEGGPHNADDPTPDAVFTVTGIVGASTTCTATETAPDGYTQTATTCADVVLAATGSASCTITNTQNSATFTVNKAYVGANGPAVSISLDCGTGTEGGPHNADDPTPDAVFTVTGIVGASTTCTATETAPDGYTQTATTCADVVLAATGSASCTITNTQNSATILIKKVYSPAGPVTPVSVTVNCEGGNGVVQTSPQNVAPGAGTTFVINGIEGTATCHAAETVPNGYTATHGDCATFQVPENSTNFECTITNTLNSAKLTVNKAWSDDNPDAVTITVTCTAENGTVVAPNPTEVTEIAAGVFIITGIETSTTCQATEDLNDPDLVGYTANQANCAAVMVGENQQDASCTITNTLNTDTFVVQKAYSGGDTQPQVNVTLSCATGTVLEGAQGADDPTPDATFNVQGFTGNPMCTGTETSVPAGYTSTGTCQALLSAGGCTITNTLATDGFTVVKDYIGGGTEPQVSVTLSCTSGTVTNSPQPADEGLNAVFNVQEFAGDPTCTATETMVPAGYNSTGTCNALLSVGTCTITNTLRSDTFVVHKDYVGGGTEPQVDVTLSCASGSVVEGGQDAGDPTPDATFTVIQFVGNPTCTATETSIPDGYTSTGTCNASLETGTCTITNTLNSAKLTVNKNFVPDNGATVSITVVCTAENGTIVAPNPKDVTEVAPGVFVITGIETSTTCTATEDLADADLTNYVANQTGCANVSVGENQQDASCTIVNQLKGQLTVDKICTPANEVGVQAIFTFSISGGPQDVGIFCAATSETYYLTAGDYTVTEEVTGLYKQISIVCDDANGGSTVTVVDGGVYNCDITNEPFGQLKVIKNCEPATDNTDVFDIEVEGAGALPDETAKDIECNDQDGYSFELPAGSYTVEEVLFTSLNTYEYLNADFTDCGDEGEVTVVAGQLVTCTILNSALFDITVLKACGEDAAAEATANDVTFTFSLFEGDDAEPLESISGVECGEIATFDDIPAVTDGSYYVVEETDLLPEGWSQLGNNCDDLVATNMPSEGEGEDERNCTITNGFADPEVGKVVDEAHPNIVMNGGIPTVQAGDDFDYIIRVINQGDAEGDFYLEDYDLTGATLDSLTPNTGVDPSTGASIFCAIATDGFGCDIEDLGAGEYIDFVVTVTANDSCDPINNFARVSYLIDEEPQEEVVNAAFPEDFEGFGTEVQAVQVNVTGCVVDLDVTKGQRLGDAGGFTTTTLEVEPGDEVQYRIVIENEGDVTLTDVVIEDPISGDLDLIAIVSDPDNRCDIVAGDLVCDGFDLEPGESYTVIIEVEVDDCDLITNRANGDAFELGTQQSNAVQLDCEVEEDEDPQEPTTTPSPSPTPVNQVQGVTTQPQQPRISEVLPTRLPATGTGDSIVDTANSNGIVNYALLGGLAMLLVVVFFGTRRLLSRER